MSSIREVPHPGNQITIRGSTHRFLLSSSDPNFERNAMKLIRVLLSTLLLLAGFTSATLGAAPAWVHAMLTTASPASGATVAPPATIELDFSEKLAPAFSGFTLTRAGAPVALQKITAGKQNSSLSAAPGTPLAAGKYDVVWHAVASDDGHRTTGTHSFTVR